MSRKRVVVTGLGVVSCLGNEIDTFYDNLLAGVSGVKTITSFPCEDYATRFAGWVPEFNPEPYLDKKTSSSCGSFYYVHYGCCEKSYSDVSMGQRAPSCRSFALWSYYWLRNGGD